MARIYLGNVKGPKGDTGATGATGPQGEAATVNVGTVSTTAYGNAAQVTNTGTENDAVFNFVIPQGKPGEKTTKMGELTLDTITTSTDEFPSPAVGDTGATVFGKIVKFFADALASLNSKISTSKIANDFTTTDASYVAAAPTVKALNDSLTNYQQKLSELLTSNVGTVRGDSLVYKKAGILVIQIDIFITTAVAQWGKFASFSNGFEPGMTAFGFIVAGGSQGDAIRVYANGSGIYTAAPLTANTVYYGSIVAMT